jgi:lantibiotic leader peptide-processing serine protease
VHVRLRMLLLALLAAAVFVTVASAATSGSAGAAVNYVVLYKSQAVPKDVASTISAAGGSLVYSYGQIGVVIARSSNDAFRANLLKDTRIENASSTAGFATRLPNEQAAAGPADGDLPNAPASDTDNLSPLQWDMRQIHTPEAHAVTGGSPAVVVGDIDTGLDYHHPDLAPNVDATDSVSCLGGAPTQGVVAANDDNGHGTHTAGTIAAAANGLGIVGVAPNVKIAGIKAGDADGFFFPDAVICSFVWAATHHIDVTNNSYFADPYLFNCRNDPVQRAIWKAESRAILYAEQNGVTVVSAEGNESEDLSHPVHDATSPDTDPSPAGQDVTNACVVIPVEVPGVIGVTATGNDRQSDSNGNPIGGYLKSFYSSVGISTTDVTAPGGDSVFGRTAEAPNGRVLSTWPPNIPCLRSVQEPVSDPNEPTAVYCYLQGTSMASPHAAGVAALIVSMFGSASSPQNGKLRPDQVKAYLDQTADPQPCPTFLPPTYESVFGVGFDSGLFYPCQGGSVHNSWYGNGQVNAFNAVTHTSGK